MPRARRHAAARRVPAWAVAAAGAVVVVIAAALALHHAASGPAADPSAHVTLEPVRSTTPTGASAAPSRLPTPTPRPNGPNVPDGGHLAVAALDLATGRQYIGNGDQRFHTASIVKVDILATLLWQDQRAATTMTADQMALATKMIQVSDNSAADALFALIGGQTGLAAGDRAFGLTETTPGTTTSHPWGQTLTTARDQLRLLRVVAGPGGPLTEASRAYILSLMKGVTSGQRWGIPVAADPGATVYVKDGWLAEQTDNWRWIVNSIGRIVEPGHDYLVVTLSDHSRTESAGITALEHLAAAAVASLHAGA